MTAAGVKTDLTDVVNKLAYSFDWCTYTSRTDESDSLQICFFHLVAFEN